MTEPIPTPPPVLTANTKAWIAAILSTLATIIFVAARFLARRLAASGVRRRVRAGRHRCALRRLHHP